MQARLDVVCSVVPEIAGQAVEPSVHDIERGFVGILGIQSGVVVVGNPTRGQESQNHWEDKDDQALGWPEPRQGCDNGDHE